MATDHLLQFFSWDFLPAPEDQRQRTKFDGVHYCDMSVHEKGILGMSLICCCSDRMGLFLTKLLESMKEFWTAAKLESGHKPAVVDGG